MTKKTITLYVKTTGCNQCDMTKRRLVAEGIAKKLPGFPVNIESALDDVEIKTVYIDQPENAGTLAVLKEQGLMEAPIVLVDFPVSVDGKIVDHWTGFNPDAIKATVLAVKPVTN